MSFRKGVAGWAVLEHITRDEAGGKLSPAFQRAERVVETKAQELRGQLYSTGWVRRA